MPAASVAFREQLESLYAISVDIARVRELPQVLDRSFGYCLELTASEFGFTGSEMDVSAIKGFQPSDPTFHERFHRIPIRPSLFSAVVKEGEATVSNDVLHDPNRVGSEGAPGLLLEHITESVTHFGLKSMKRQVDAVGGSLALANGDEGGFAVRVTVPR
jgi:hypothetical protein